MKIIAKIFNILAATVMSATLFSCGKTEIIDVGYPDDSVYFPSAAAAANEGKTAYELFDLATSGEGSHRFNIDLDNNRFVIPMSVCRGGIDNSGAIDVDLATDDGIVTTMINEGSLGYLNDEGGVRTINFIPESEITFPDRISIADGKDISTFDIVINFDYLQNRVGELFAIALEIESSSAEISEDLGVVVMVIDTGFMEIIPDFEIVQSENNMLQMTFTDTSNGAVAWSWDFGDGVSSNEQNPGHTYSSYGKKTVKLTITGVLGNTAEITKTVSVWEDISESFFNGNTGKPFEPSAGNVGPPLGWSVNQAVLDQPGGSKGWTNWGDWIEGMGGKGGTMQIEAFGDVPGIEDARVWCTKELQPGDYRFIVQTESTGIEPAGKGELTEPSYLDLYFCAVKGTELCAAGTIDENQDVLGKTGWNFSSYDTNEQVPVGLHEVDFTVEETGSVSVGVSVGFGKYGFFRVMEVQLLYLPE